ncbi:hypothetical protein GCM10010916_33680 [Paenibacillus abyssi]|uniref:Uncharacterized protein n=1 Tax=Paenibacillus abyssi TaxID=1340531 RepID=A0A917FYC2_9BACL|nr:hypothetical protein GCM10010916_33680 [Paenibacillus abyssi]
MIHPSITPTASSWNVIAIAQNPIKLNNPISVSRVILLSLSIGIASLTGTFCATYITPKQNENIQLFFVTR